VPKAGAVATAPQAASPAGVVLAAFRAYVTARPEPAFARWFDGFDWSQPERPLSPAAVPALAHLPGAPAFAGPAERDLAATFARHGPALAWRRTYGEADFGRHFFENYAHVELIGPRGHFASASVAAGLALYGPGVDYPDHWHAAEEIYVPLTGAGVWSRDGGAHRPRAAGEFVFHAANMRHAMRSLDAPLLVLWVWRGGDLAQKSEH
jgi:mannose-6-phosphate isomerase-like protein (cupin superfamily)